MVAPDIPKRQRKKDPEEATHAKHSNIGHIIKLGFSAKLGRIWDKRPALEDDAFSLLVAQSTRLRVSQSDTISKLSPWSKA